MDDSDQQCGVCGTVKSASHFTKGTSRRCKQCHALRVRSDRTFSIKKFLAYKLTKAKARKRFSVEIDIDDLIALWESQNGLCAITKVPMIATDDDGDFGISIDRIDSDKGYAKGNVRLTCARVNIMRSTLTDAMLYWWAVAISTGTYED